MSDTSPPKELRRYTDLPSLLYLLHNKCITFLDPASWDDTNDSYFLLKYKEKKKLQSVLALCFSQTEETYHHWRVFAGSASGVCVIFDRQSLFATLLNKRAIPNKGDDILKGPVKYHQVRELRRDRVKLSVRDLPFAKRAGFTPEKEFRVLYTSLEEQKQYLDIRIDLSSIDEIRLSPWLNDRLAEWVETTIHLIPGCKGLKVHRSTLIGNTTWKEFGDRAT